MTDAQESWREVGKTLEGLGLKLKMHLERAQGEMEGERFRDALEAAGAGVQKAFDALGEAVRDPAIKDDVRQAATSRQMTHRSSQFRFVPMDQYAKRARSPFRSAYQPLLFDRSRCLWLAFRRS